MFTRAAKGVDFPGILFIIVNRELMKKGFSQWTKKNMLWRNTPNGRANYQ